MFLASSLVKFVLMMIGHPYWYGTCIYPCTDKLLKDKTAQYPAHYGNNRTSKYKSAIAQHEVCCDCVGLYKGFAWTNGGEGVQEYLSGKTDTITNKYASNGCPDLSANGMLEYCQSKGKRDVTWGLIDTIPEIPGIAVFYKGHTGVYVGCGLVVEARGFNYGVAKTELRKRGWTHWAMLPFIDYSEYADAKPVPSELGDRTLRNGMSGEDVRKLQTGLIGMGYTCGSWGADGDFGDATEMAVTAFQLAHGLDGDGIFGPKSYAAYVEAMSAEIEEPKGVLIVGGNCWIRNEPNTEGVKIAVAYEGQEYEYAGETSANSWNKIKHGDLRECWVSGKYSRLISGGDVG